MTPDEHDGPETTGLVDLHQLERDWAEQLQTASLVVQVDYRDEDAILALKRIGYFFQTKKTDQILRLYPASFLVGLNYVASAQMQQATLWPFIFKGLNELKPTQPLQEVISRLHRLALNKFQLERFEHPLGRIGEILLHAGIPLSSQEKFVRKLIRDFKIKDNFDAASFNESIRSIAGDRVQSASLDKQIWHFINQAGSVADDFVAKCIEILDEPDNPASGAGLPQRIISEVARIVDELGKSGLQRAGRSGTRIRPPKIVWSKASDNQLEVVFPVIPESQDSAVRWTLEVDEGAITLDIAQEIAGLSRQQRSLEIKRPAAQISVRSESLATDEQLISRSWTLTLFPEELPVLFFDSEGELDLGKGPLEPGMITVLYPSKSRLSADPPNVTVDGDHELRALDAPLGWGTHDNSSIGWLAIQVDATNAEAIEISFGKASKPFRRAISAYKKPRPNHNGLVPGVFDHHDLPVYSEFPEFEVGSLSADEDGWAYEVRSENRKVVWSSLTKAEGGIVKAQPPGDLSGSFVIQISRGFGQTTTVTRTVIQGLRSDYNGSTRKLREDGGGLEEAEFSIFVPGAGEQKLRFGKKQRAVQVEVEQADGALINVRPDYEYLQLFNTRSKKHTEWIEPTKSNVENLTELQLFFSSKDARVAALVARWPNGESQVLAAKISTPWFKFNLGELSDKANSEGSFRLEIRVEQERTLQAGTCYPKKLFTDATVDQSANFVEFNFPGSSVPEGLQVAFYAPSAPWRKPVVVEISQTVVEVPQALRTFGTLVGSVAVSSPWAPFDFGTSPDYESANVFEVSVLPPRPELDAENALVHWVSTGEESPKLREMDAELAWTCFTRAADLQGRRGVSPFAIKNLAAEILTKTADAIRKYPASTRSRTETLIDLIDSGLVAQSPGETQLQVLENLNRPVLAFIGVAFDDAESSSHLLNAGASAWGAANPKDSEASGIEVLNYKLNLLNFKNPEVAVMIKLDDDMFIHLSDGYLPGRLLDGGNIFLNIFRVLYAEADALTKGLGPDWTGEVSESLEEIGDLVQEDLKLLLDTRPFLSAAEVREIQGIRSRIANWPAISWRMAIAARLAARGDERAMLVFETNKGFYLKMAKALPSLVEIDITIAELALREIEYQK